MTPKVSIDTNIIVYAVDGTAGEKHRRASELLYGCARLGATLTQQVLGEFLCVLNRSGLDNTLGLAIAARARHFMQLEQTGPDDLVEAFHLAQTTRVQFWDAVIVTVCRRVKVDLLITEDMQDGRDFGGVRIVNPFLYHNRDRLHFLLGTG